MISIHLCLSGCADYALHRRPSLLIEDGGIYRTDMTAGGLTPGEKYLVLFFYLPIPEGYCLFECSRGGGVLPL